LNKHKLNFRLGGFGLVVILLVTLLTACEDEATSTSIPLSKNTPSPTVISVTSNVGKTAQTTQISNLGDTSAAGGNVVTAAVSTPTPATQLIGPTVGANGQITVNAPPADGKSVSGRFYWIKGGADIWVGGTGAGKALSNTSLGGQLLLPVPSGGLQKDPMLSPDGTMLAYAYSPPPYLDAAGTPIFGEDIYLLNMSTKKTQIVVKRADPEEFLEYPAWSADSQTLYFASRAPLRENNRVVGSKLMISSYNLKTQQRQDLTKDGSEPFPLPDGKSLIYIGIMASDDTYAYSLRIFDLQTRQSKVLLTAKENFFGFRAPRPSPDGKTILFAGIGGPDEVPLANPPTSAANNQPAPAPAPTIKKSGSSLLQNFDLLTFGWADNAARIKTSGAALPNLHGLPYDLWEIKPGGDGLHRLTTLFEDEPVAAWSKDGQHIVFLTGNGFYTCNADGSSLSKKADEGAHGGFTWQP